MPVRDDNRGRGRWRAASLALVLVAAANAWVGHRLETLIAETSVGDIGLLDERVRAFPARARVRLLVFGNSHAMFALRPPVLAPALGREPAEAFNLALGGGTVLEARLLARRHRAAFPAARLAVVLVDEPLMGRGRNQDARQRWLTRFDPAGRWRVASYFGEVDQRVTAMAWLALPIADFNAQLRREWASDRARFVRRLRGEDVPLAPQSTRARYAAMAYPWGYPIGEYDPPEAVRRKYARARTPAAMHKLARYFLEDADKLPQAFEDLEGLCLELEAQGLQVQLVGGTLPSEFRQALTEVHGPALTAYRAELAAYLARSGRALVPLPDLPLAAYGDGDHLTEAGARTVASWLATQRPQLRDALRGP